ncbi:hypothetical protein [Legionella bononiensis]|uniref:Uncharacterized protein n=1 Tax=Legionella bononiensis TaxID=2793102 RepID=A0ABS1WD35_9GAMM|nr:hypothetical protein [Legionella bononiensis]MBL7479129.1 hypothetical protein [Legionella bononiensis]MBL7527262.1 hypothetical protein [Legionella bononiensis]MBL7562231.1 hypothetical protein [Legionella bononiensis]
MNKLTTTLLLPIFIFEFSISSIINASAAPKIPADLMYNNKPINPLCFDQEESSNKTLSLTNNCDLAPIEVVGQSKELLNKGYVGFEYKLKDDSDTTSSYSYYKVIGYFNHFYTILSISNTGGSGHFSSIYLVKRDHDQLHIKTLPFGGDRCNGGLDEVTQNKNILSFSSNITPGDFLSISNNNPKKLQAYDDLDACAACCVATALYKTDLQQDSTQATLTSIQFANDPDTLSELKSNDSTGYQACFNQLVLHYIAKNKTTLTVKELGTFMSEFNTNCTQHN